MGANLKLLRQKRLTITVMRDCWMEKQNLYCFNQTKILKTLTVRRFRQLEHKIYTAYSKNVRAKAAKCRLFRVQASSHLRTTFIDSFRG
jgi:hypothetical protein